MDVKALILGGLKSKTVWLGIVTVIGANVPAINAWIMSHVSGDMAVTLVGLVGIVLRYLTTQSVATKGGEPPKA